MVKRVSVLALAGLMVAAPAMAQDIGANPTYADVTLSEGFMPDPRVVQVTAGGSIDAASSRGGSCVGMIARAPDVRLTYAAGSSPLSIAVQSSGDTTLVINGANGAWFCDDDSGGGLNPRFIRRNPEPGVYEIWVGSLSGAVPARVLISEMVN